VNRQAILVLEDGTSFLGESFGAEGEAVGEVVFNTSMTGYQEIITDPSYKGQMVAMTCPLIGNYGVNAEDGESDRPWLSGFIVKEYTRTPSNWRAQEPLDALLVRHGVVAIEGIDTRALTRRLREKGAMQGVISTQRFDVASLCQTLRAAPTLDGQDMVRHVTRREIQTAPEGPDGIGPHVVVYDFGVKQNILRMLAQQGCRVTIVPAATSATQVLAMHPEGVLLSNGPGDPVALPYAIQAAERLLTEKPLFGICLGHQILGLALGGKCIKLKFGHHGGNHPVLETATGRVQVTAQNHNYAIDFSAVSDVEVTHVSLNDRTVEGMRHKRLPVASVQFHPEAAPGPHDAHPLLAAFVASLKQG
jgi:carbamoyl-phosphate synthase small subunit